VLQIIMLDAPNFVLPQRTNVRPMSRTRSVNAEGWDLIMVVWCIYGSKIVNLEDLYK
jgi:hypothetical protein